MGEGGEGEKRGGGGGELEEFGGGGGMGDFRDKEEGCMLISSIFQCLCP